MKKISWLNIFIILLPFIDFWTSIATWNNSFSPGLLIKGIFLFYAIYYILKNKKEKKIWLLLLSYGIIFLIYYFMKDKSLLKGEITNLIKIYYLPILILFFSSCKESKIKKSTLTIIYLEYLLLYLLPYPFHLGHNINEIYPNKYLYLSYFYVGNELANIFILLIPSVFVYLIEEKKKYIPFILILTILMLLLLGTKTTYLSMLIILIYFLFHYRTTILPKIKKQKIPIIGITICIITSLIIWIPRSNLYNNIKTQLEFYEVNTLNELFTIENINNIIYSNRLYYLKNIHEKYKEANPKEKVMGIGRTAITQEKDIEIDIFDIFYSIGILGFIIYLIVFIYVLKNTNMNSETKFTFILLTVISLFTGHVLISPMTTSYLACIFGVERKKYEKLDKKSNKKIKNRAYA